MKKELDLFQNLTLQLLDKENTDAVTKHIPSQDIAKNINLSLSEDSISDTEYLKTLEDLVLHSPSTASNKFFNQLYGGRQPKAVLGDLLAVLLNNSMYTYKVAGIQAALEKEVLREVAKLTGYDLNSFGGTMPTGGSMSNFMALIMARDYKDKQVKHKGVRKTMIAYSSELSHYSNAKNASFAGIGRDNVRYIKADDYGKMIPEEFEKQVIEDLENGFLPFYVNVTAGTTVLGAFDPINAIADICEKHKIWLHVDGAYCGAVIFSDKHKHLIEGLERSDSFSFNPHKMLGTPLTCSIILAKRQEDLFYSFSQQADYLYQTDDQDYDLGQYSFQCGRRNDALKIWSLWKSVGSKGLESIVDQEFNLADVTREYVRNHPDYTLYSYDDSLSICFNYKGIDPKKICTDLHLNQVSMVGFGKHKEDTFIRFVTINSNNKKEDILNFFKTMEEFVAKNY